MTVYALFLWTITKVKKVDVNVKNVDLGKGMIYV